MRAKFRTNRLNTLQRPGNDLCLVMFVGCCGSRIVSVAFVDISSLLGWLRDPSRRYGLQKRCTSLVLMIPGSKYSPKSVSRRLDPPDGVLQTSKG